MAKQALTDTNIKQAKPREKPWKLADAGGFFTDRHLWREVVAILLPLRRQAKKYPLAFIPMRAWQKHGGDATLHAGYSLMTLIQTRAVNPAHTHALPLRTGGYSRRISDHALST